MCLCIHLQIENRTLALMTHGDKITEEVRSTVVLDMYQDFALNGVRIENQFLLYIVLQFCTL